MCVLSFLLGIVVGVLWLCAGTFVAFTRPGPEDVPEAA